MDGHWTDFQTNKAWSTWTGFQANKAWSTNLNLLRHFNDNTLMLNQLMLIHVESVWITS